MKAKLTGHLLALGALQWLKFERRCILVMTERGPMYWRPDALGVTQARYGIEIEAKVSKADFLADREKPQNQGRDKGIDHWVRQFYYLVPKDLKSFALENLPDWAGLLVPYYDNASPLCCVKKAPVNRGAKRYAIRTMVHCVAMQSNQLISLVDEVMKNSQEKLKEELRQVVKSKQSLWRRVNKYTERHYKLKHEVQRLRKELCTLKSE